MNRKNVLKSCKIKIVYLIIYNYFYVIHENFTKVTVTDNSFYNSGLGRPREWHLNKYLVCMCVCVYVYVCLCVQHGKTMNSSHNWLQFIKCMENKLKLNKEILIRKYQMYNLNNGKLINSIFQSLTGWWFKKKIFRHFNIVCLWKTFAILLAKNSVKNLNVFPSTSAFAY